MSLKSILFRKLSLLLLMLVSNMLMNAQITTGCNACAKGATIKEETGYCEVTGLTGYFVPPPNNASWELIFDEEFDGTPLDFDNIWDSPFHMTSVEDTSQWYTCYMRDNLAFGSSYAGNNLLHWINLQTQYEPGTVCDWVEFINNQAITHQITRDYTMPWLKTIPVFGPGKFEIHCKIPAVSGQWPAFWLYENDGGVHHGQELDIFEIKQDKPVGNQCLPDEDAGCDNPPFVLASDAGKRMMMTTHADPLTPGDNKSCTTQMCYLNSESLSNGWHTYSIDWDENYIKWYMDGNLVNEINRFYYSPLTMNTIKDLTFPSPKVKMQIIISSVVWATQVAYYTNIAYCGAPSTPNDFLVDYLRVWKRGCNNDPKTLRFDYDPVIFYDPNDAVVKAGSVDFSSNSPTWKVFNNQILKVGAQDEIKIVNFEAHLGSDFQATIEHCNEFDYGRSVQYQDEINYRNTVAHNLVLAPNPALGSFKIVAEKPVENASVLIYDLRGVKISETFYPMLSAADISLEEMSAGFYFVRVVSKSDQFLETHRLIKQ